jgi:hypothetical protein
MPGDWSKIKLRKTSGTMMLNSLSDYEQKRAKNIERNNARLRELGLISSLEEERSNAIAWGKRLVVPVTAVGVTINNNDDHDNAGSNSVAGKLKKRKQKQLTQPSRKSRRLQGDNPEHNADENIERYDKAHSPLYLALTDEERALSVQECRVARLQRALKISEAEEGTTTAASSSKNPTATYAHTLMRIKSMSPPALANRVKAIERAAGKHCVVKMAIFKSCLQDEGMWDLAKLASDALERLKALLPPPAPDDPKH